MKANMKIKWLILAAAMFCAVVLLLSADTDKEKECYADKSLVYGVELGDLFWLDHLTSDETLAYLNVKPEKVITHEEVCEIFTAFGYGTVVETFKNECDATELLRENFIRLYELYLKQVKKDVQEETFIYLGHVPRSENIVTNIGNFKTSLPEHFFTYGHWYRCICSQNQILVMKEELLTASEYRDLQQEQSEDVLTSSECINVPSLINVVLTNDNGQQPLRSHFQIRLISSGCLTAGTKKELLEKNKIITEKEVDHYFNEQDHVTIIPDQEQSICIKEADSGTYSEPYRGILHIYKKKGQYYLVNELETEQYLLGVVPGEMPERFHLEALKAQAVCARTYACNMLSSDRYKEYHADVDDSVNCQVYNKHGENEKAARAVEETKGIVLLSSQGENNSFFDLELADIYYFSTSCGFTTGLEAWGSSSLPYLRPVSTLLEPETITDWAHFLKDNTKEAYDSDSNLFRWKTVIRLSKDQTLSIDQRETCGIVTKITFHENGQKRSVSTEYEIRKAISPYIISMTDKNGEKINSMSILPSAWFVSEQGSVPGEYILYGGGYGHGIGMCQYGAHGMAKSGWDFMKILRYYYPDIIIKELV